MAGADEKQPDAGPDGACLLSPRCESACNRGQLDEAVSIHAVERFLGDEARKRGWQFETVAAPSGKKILIVGAGPSGLRLPFI